MITEQRKQYIKDWKRKNRDKVNSAFKIWYSKNRDKSYYNRVNPKDGFEFCGTSGLGRKYEIIAQSLLKDSKLSPNFHYPYDLEWNGLKIEVKMRNKNSKGVYHFSKKLTCVADYFFCFCLDEGIKYILLIPSSVYKNGKTLNNKLIESKYKKYLFIVKEQ